MKRAFLFLFIGSFLWHRPAGAWGRHDLITEFAIQSSTLLPLKDTKVPLESIEMASPDLLKNALPELQKWARLFHKEHDKRFVWNAPEDGQGLFDHLLTPHERLLWALEDNIRTPLLATPPTDASSILIRHVEDPDGDLDSGLHVKPYLARLRERMGLFFDGGAHTHTFRHFYVPSSWLPPLSSPRGEAPYRAALYAKLSILSFKSGHRYWGYRFLAWSIHYAQDVTQPWHTVFVPSVSYLRLSAKKMRREISAFHYLTEALADSWLFRVKPNALSPIRPVLQRVVSSQEHGPWYVAELAESAARRAHATAESVARNARPLFEPILAHLDDHLRPVTASLTHGGVVFPTQALDFTGNGAGATTFLTPIWDSKFSLAKPRDRFVEQLALALSQSLEISRKVIEYVLEESGEIMIH